MVLRLRSFLILIVIIFPSLILSENKKKEFYSRLNFVLASKFEDKPKTKKKIIH